MATTDVERFLDGVAQALTYAIGPSALLAATQPPPGIGIERAIEAGSLRVGGRVLRSPLPRVTLRFASGLDAAALADSWGIEGPIAVSGDVHQTTWRMAVRGPVLSDPVGQRIELKEVVSGCWAVTARLHGRPRGDLPDLRAGASPVYDLRERREVVRSISVERVMPGGRLTSARDPAAVRLLDAARARNPYARPGWVPIPDCPFVVIESGEKPVAGAALHVDRVVSLANASAIAIDPAAAAPDSTGADLIDVLEAFAVESGAGTIRLDGTAFFFAESLGLADRGYAVGPPYDGDADVEVWVERRLDE